MQRDNSGSEVHRSYNDLSIDDPIGDLMNKCKANKQTIDLEKITGSHSKKSSLLIEQRFGSVHRSELKSEDSIN